MHLIQRQEAKQNILDYREQPVPISLCIANGLNGFWYWILGSMESIARETVNWSSYKHCCHGDRQAYTSRILLLHVALHSLFCLSTFSQVQSMLHFHSVRSHINQQFLLIPFRGKDVLSSVPCRHNSNRCIIQILLL